MTDRYEHIRAAMAERDALVAALRERLLRETLKDADEEASMTKPEAQRLADHLEQFRSFPDDIAAAGELRRLHTENEALLAERDALVAEVERLREALKELVNWIPSADVYHRMGFDPSTPMEALKEAKAVLFKEA